MLITETERLEIRPFVRRDIRALSGILGDPDVMEFSIKGPLTEDDTSDFIDWCLGSYEEHAYGPSAVIEKFSGRLIGFCGLSHATVDECDEIEIGYRFAKDQWGKGFASEAANGVLAYGFDALSIESVVGIVSPRHSASIRVLEKTGFRDFSEARYCGWDVRIYRLDRKEWKSFNTRL